MFEPVIEGYFEKFSEGPIVVSFDDTKIKKTGKKIPETFWQRDPMSPPFHANIQWSLRIAHASLSFPTYLIGGTDARGIPVRYWSAPAIKKPGKRATDKEIEAYKKRTQSFHCLSGANEKLT